MEIENLKLEIEKKDRTITGLKGKTLQNKQLETELLEVYRVVKYLEGKVSIMEKHCEMYEKSDMFKEVMEPIGEEIGELG